jgi:hypothetical protein
VVFIYTVPMGEGDIRYWAVQSGWLVVEGGGIKDACLVATYLQIRPQFLYQE